MKKTESLTGSWGLLGPHDAGTARRTRSLGLASAVRTFNDRAVPGLGGLWFAKPLVLSLLGVVVARESHRPNIEVANAIEALACRLAFRENGGRQDPRLRGRIKLQHWDDLSYARARRPHFYVTQPMRQATIQPLRALGLVESDGERFNGFAPSELGEKLIERAFGSCRPNRTTLTKYLLSWVGGAPALRNSKQLLRALSPCERLDRPALDLIRERLMASDSPILLESRRAAALAWVAQVAASPNASVDWKMQPDMIDPQHWQDLRVGALFFQARDAALELLDLIETILGARQDQSLRRADPLPDPITDALSGLRLTARNFTNEKHDPSPDRLATQFLAECQLADDREVMFRLVERDGRGLRLQGDRIVPGSAFKGAKGEAQTSASESNPDQDGNELAHDVEVVWPEGISYRLNNLFLLNQDLDGKLEKWIHEA